MVEQKLKEQESKTAKPQNNSSLDTLQIELEKQKQKTLETQRQLLELEANNQQLQVGDEIHLVDKTAKKNKKKAEQKAKEEKIKEAEAAKQKE